MSTAQLTHTKLSTPDSEQHIKDANETSVYFGGHENPYLAV